MKKQKVETFNAEPPDKPEYKSFYYYLHNPLQKEIFNYLGGISKNIYNTGLYSIQVFNLFKTTIYNELYNYIIKNKVYDKKICDDYVKDKLNCYFDLYSSLKDKIKTNNNYIYKHITSFIKSNNIIIKNSNIYYYISKFITELNKDQNIYNDKINNKLLINNIVNNIINSIYTRNYNLTKNELLGHKKLSINDEELINNVKNNEYISIIEKNIYKQKIKEELKIDIGSDQNFISCLAYSKLGANKNKLDTTSICNIISKAYESYSSYYKLCEIGIKANRPKFLDKNAKFPIPYVFSKTISINKNLVKIYTSTFMKDNFINIFGDKYIKLDKYHYIELKYLKLKKGKITKKDNYIIDNKYIEKTNINIIDSRYLNIEIPKKCDNLDIKVLEVSFINEMVKISLKYKTHYKKHKKEKIKSNEAISIDLGMKNLMTIYNPSGTQKIIDGKFISSINTYYNNKIAKAQSSNNQMLFYKYQMKRKFIINNYFNKIVSWMTNEYSNKKLIIFGYNKEWKQNTNLGKDTNMKFNKIPYMTLINKIKLKFTELNKFVLLTEESYTSKCDALALENLCKQDNYLGKRIKRGLFQSNSNKLLNADLNGAINIMRKVFNLQTIEGKSLLNPERVKIFRDV